MNFFQGVAKSLILIFSTNRPLILLGNVSLPGPWRGPRLSKGARLYDPFEEGQTPKTIFPGLSTWETFFRVWPPSNGLHNRAPLSCLGPPHGPSNETFPSKIGGQLAEKIMIKVFTTPWKSSREFPPIYSACRTWLHYGYSVHCTQYDRSNQNWNLEQSQYDGSLQK